MGRNGRPGHLLDDRRVKSDGRVHIVHAEEGGCPGWFMLTCSCGWSQVARFGKPQATYFAETHLWKVGAPLRKANKL